jgi:hypothetical protein
MRLRAFFLGGVMGELKYPVRDYSGPPDWDDLGVDFAGSGLLYFRLSVAELKQRARGQVSFLAVPYAELTTGRALIAQQAAEWRAQLLPDLVAVSPAVDAEALLETGRASVSAANNAAWWRGMTRMYLNASDAVIIPPIDGWDRSLELYQIAEAALAGNRPVYVIGRGRQ